MMNRPRPTLGSAIFLMLALTLGGYFTFAAVQGDYGVFRRVQIEAQTDALRLERDALVADLSAIRNKTQRLSDGFLDIDLLDEQARDVLGLIRSDEIVIR